MYDTEFQKSKWVKSSGNSPTVENEPEAIAPKAEIAAPTIESLKQQYGSEWESAAVYFGLVSPNSPTVENEEVNPSW